MNHSILAISILLTICSLSEGHFNCLATSCTCSQSPNRGYDIDCPNSFDPQVKLSLTFEEPKDFVVDCRQNAKYVDYLPQRYLPPNTNFLKLDFLWFKMCSLPNNITVRHVMNRLQIQSARKMRINFSDLTNITKEDLDGLQSVENLEVMNNIIGYLPSDLLYDMQKLTILDIKENDIVIPQDFFKMNPNLKNIELAGNYLPDNTTGMFSNLKNLTFLNMWGMSIQELDINIFQDLENLESLDLSTNKISYLQRDLLTNLVNLKDLSLRRNEFYEIPKDFFKNNKLLETVNLIENNYLTDIPSSLFEDMINLSIVEMSYCNITGLPENTFWNSKNISKLSLNYNYIENLQDDLFRDQYNLIHLNLEYNNLVRLSKDVFRNLKSLETLNLNHNYIILADHSFYGLSNLKTLSLKYNELKEVKKMFRNINKLQVLDLSFNELTLLENASSDMFGLWCPISDMLNLEKLLLSHNNISDVFVDWRITRLNLKTLDLSYNSITNISYDDINFLQESIKVNLQHNKIKTINMARAELIVGASESETSGQTYQSKKHIVVDVSNNPLHCSCSLYDLFRYYDMSMDPEVRAQIELKSDNLTCASPENMAGAKIDEVKSGTFICDVSEENKKFYDSICHPKSKCYLKPSVRTLMIDLSNTGLTEAPVLNFRDAGSYPISSVQVILQRNNLTKMPKPGMGYDNVKLLDVSNNYITTFDWLPPNLHELYLDNNNFTMLNTVQLALFNKTSIQNISLHNNPWACDCDTVNFNKYLQENFKKIENLHNITCSGNDLEMVNLTVDQLCPLPTEIIITLSVIVAIVSLLVAVLAGIYYKYNMEIKVWLYAHQQCLWLVTEEEMDKDKIYDAFISYSHKDEEFIIHELLSNLETGPKPYKLCLHFRNWQPGEFITTNIAKSVAESKRTIVILSPNFLSSEWGKMEFRTAHIQALSEGRARVIIVLFGDIPTDDLDDELKAYLNTNTYVKWGDPWFWDKLRYALPHCTKYAKHMYVNSLEKIKIYDDKSGLINEPSTPPIGTTPPADKVNFDPLIKNGFNVLHMNKSLVSGGFINNDLVSKSLNNVGFEKHFVNGDLLDGYQLKGGSLNRTLINSKMNNDGLDNEKFDHKLFIDR